MPVNKDEPDRPGDVDGADTPPGTGARDAAAEVPACEPAALAAQVVHVPDGDARALYEGAVERILADAMGRDAAWADRHQSPIHAADLGSPTSTGSTLDGAVTYELAHGSETSAGLLEPHHSTDAQGFDYRPAVDDRIAPAETPPAAVRIEPVLEMPDLGGAPSDADIADVTSVPAGPARSAHAVMDGAAISPPVHVGLHAQAATEAAGPLAVTPSIGVPAPASAPAPATGTQRSAWWSRARMGLKILLVVFAGYLALVLLLILLYRFVDPPGSTLMAYQWLKGTKINRTWVPIEDISHNLIRAVVVAEDSSFCRHWGIDLGAMKEAIDRAGDGTPRGASTISMQVAKNLFLTHSKSYVRKAVEIPLTVVAEGVWPKQRMLEIYLNIAEWGPGIFGAEAAAQHHFGKPAARLSEREAALLASVLPNPIIRSAGKPGPQTTRKASVVQARMRASRSVADCAMPQKAAAGSMQSPPAAKSTTAPKPAGQTGAKPSSAAAQRPAARQQPAKPSPSRPPAAKPEQGPWNTSIERLY